MRPARSLWLAPLLLLGCQQGNGSTLDLRHTREAGGTTVASWKNDRLTAEELQRRFTEMNPYVRARYQTLEQKKDYVDGLARFELIAAEAARRGLLEDPEVVAAAKRVMVDRFLRLELEEKPTPIAEETVRAHYESHKADYVKPEMVRLSHVFLAAPPGDPHRAEKLNRAKGLLEKARALPPMDFQSFAKLVRESSEEPRTQPLDGDLRYLSQEDLAAQYGAEVAQASKALTQVGQVASEVVATDKGFHVLKLQGRQAALNLSAEQVKTQIQNILLHEEKMKRYNALMDRLKKEAGFTVQTDALAKVAVDPKAPAVPAKGPQPGFLPPPARAQTE